MYVLIYQWRKWIGVVESEKWCDFLECYLERKGSYPRHYKTFRFRSNIQPCPGKCLTAKREVNCTSTIINVYLGCIFISGLWNLRIPLQISITMVITTPFLTVSMNVNNLCWLKINVPIVVWTSYFSLVLSYYHNIQGN